MLKILVIYELYVDVREFWFGFVIIIKVVCWWIGDCVWIVWFIFVWEDFLLVKGDIVFEDIGILGRVGFCEVRQIKVCVMFCIVVVFDWCFDVV